MKSRIFTIILLLVCFLFIFANSFSLNAQTCKPSGNMTGAKPPPKELRRKSIQLLHPRQVVHYLCSPPISRLMKAILTLSSFEEGGDGGASSECDTKFHSDGTLMVVALSTGWWFEKKRRCSKYIYIYGNGKRVKPLAIDECDSTMGCDGDHDYHPPCDITILLMLPRQFGRHWGVPEKDSGKLEIYWSDA